MRFFLAVLGALLLVAFYATFACLLIDAKHPPRHELTCCAEQVQKWRQEWGTWQP